MKHLIVFLFLLSSTALVAVAESPPKKKIKIGISTPVTGEAATYGLDMKEILVFANEKLGKGRYELIYGDDKCNSKAAVSVAQKFVNVDKVDYALGFSCSGATLSALPVYVKAKVPIIISGASSPRIADAGDYVFRTFPSDALAAKLLAEHAIKTDRTVAVLSEETDYAQDLKNAFAAAAAKANLNIVDVDYLSGTTDFRTMLLKLRAKKPDSIFINTQAERTFAVILKQMREMKWRPTIYGAYWPGSSTLLEIAGADLEGVIFPDLPALDQILNKDGESLLEEYKREGGKHRSIETLFATSFESFRALDQATRSGGDVLDYLNQSKFNGVFGEYSFDEKGEVQGFLPVMKQIQNGKPVPLG